MVSGINFSDCIKPPERIVIRRDFGKFSLSRIEYTMKVDRCQEAMEGKVDLDFH
jgi:hypothetical protein